MTALFVMLALGFSDPNSFAQSAELGGGGGMLFTGSPSARYDCSVCHDSDPALTLTVATEPAGLFTSGYTAGQTYRLDVTLGDGPSNGGLGVEVVGDGGAGALENVPLAGRPAMELCHYGAADGGTLDVDPVTVRTGGLSAQSGTCNTGTRAWKLQWVAPASDVGPVTFYFAAVAGNGNAANTGDRSVARVLAAPSPSSKQERAKGCGAPAAMLLLPLAFVFVRGRGKGALLMLLLVPAVGLAKPKKRQKTRVPEQKLEAPVPAPAPEPEPEPAKDEVPPAAEVAPVPAPAPAPVAVVAPPPVEAAPPQEPEPPAVEVALAAGAGVRSLSLYGDSLGVPFRLEQVYPLAGVSVRFFPMRLMRVSALGGLELEGAYRIGRAIGALPGGAANALPADGRVSLGYRLSLGALSIAPRFLYRIEVGGTDRSAVFDDLLYQSVGGELSVCLEAGPLFVELRPGGGWVLDTGTASAKGYGRSSGGPTAGGTAELGVRLGATGLRLGARYQVSFTRVAFAGGGERDLGPVTSVDFGHLGMLALDVAR